jgi:hypothetical protein
MSRLTGGPTTEFFSGRLATIFGSSGFARSTINTESLPAGDSTTLPSSSNSTFSSLPTTHEWCGISLIETASAQQKCGSQHKSDGAIDRHGGILPMHSGVIPDRLLEHYGILSPGQRPERSAPRAIPLAFSGRQLKHAVERRSSRFRSVSGHPTRRATLLSGTKRRPAATELNGSSPVTKRSFVRSPKRTFTIRSCLGQISLEKPLPLFGLLHSA